MSVRLIHLTDPHLSSLAAVSWWSLAGKRWLGYLSWRWKRRHHLRAEPLRVLTAAACAEGADLAVVTGDLVHLGLAPELATARVWLDSLRAHQPVLLVPGNHDCYCADSWPELDRQLRDYTAGAEDAVMGMPSLIKIGSVSVIGLWSARPMPWWSAGGWLGVEQLLALERLLVESVGTFRCVLLHHAPLASQAPPRKALQDAGALRALLSQHGVELVLHGHLHHNAVHTLDARTRIMVTAPASSAQVSNPAAYRVIDISATDAGWQVQCNLKTLAADGAMCAVAREAWSVAALSAGG